MEMEKTKFKDIQSRLVLALTYYRILNRLTSNEITEKTGINFYMLENSIRPVSIKSLVKLESLFGSNAIISILCSAWYGAGEWSEVLIKKRILIEKGKWEIEKKIIRQHIPIS